MPNYVKNIIRFYGDKKRIIELQNHVMNITNKFDFNSIIPMPPSLKIESGSKQETAKKFAMLRKEKGKNWKRTAEFKKLAEGFDKTYTVVGEKFNVVSSRTYEEWADIGDRYILNKELYGAETWYDWCVEHWGTKWNACDASWRNYDCVEFDTAWSMPEPVYRCMAKLFPDVHFEVEFADEDIGSNCGTVTYEGDDIVVDYIEDDEFACEVWGYDYDEWKDEQEEYE